jgi:hypothetical protein
MDFETNLLIMEDYHIDEAINYGNEEEKEADVGAFNTDQNQLNLKKTISEMQAIKTRGSQDDNILELSDNQIEMNKIDADKQDYMKDFDVTLERFN